MKVGLVCNLQHFGDESNKFTNGYAIGIPNFYYGINNIFENVKIVNSYRDLNHLDCVFIGNEHFRPHLNIWCNDLFIDKCNNDNIKVIFWAGEQIHSPFYPHNLQIQKQVERFNNLYQRVLDVNDANILNKKIGGIPFSKEYEFLRGVKKNKKNRMVFIGTTHLPEYQRRFDTLDNLKKIYDFDHFEPNFKTYTEYNEILSNYRFVLCPHSTNLNGFVGRFYDSLLANSIPVQQVYEDTLDFYPLEKSYKDAIFFQNVEEIGDKIKKCDLEESYNFPYFEDLLVNFFETEMEIKFESK